MPRGRSKFPPTYKFIRAFGSRPSSLVELQKTQIEIVEIRVGSKFEARHKGVCIATGSTYHSVIDKAYKHLTLKAAEV